MQNASMPVKSKRTHEMMHIASMPFDDRPDPAKRLEQARIAAGFASAREAALRYGWKYESYVQHENGTRGITKSAKRYASAYKVSEAWLLTGEGAADANPWAEFTSLLDRLDPDGVEEVKRHVLGLIALKEASRR